MTTKTNQLSGYPENLFSLVKNPSVRFLPLSIATFALLLLSISVIWYSTHHTVTKKQAGISGIYTLAFFQNDKDTRPSDLQSMSALKILQKDSTVEFFKKIDSKTILSNDVLSTQTNVPSLLHIKIDPQKEALFNKSLNSLSQNFPSISIRNHNEDARITALQLRYSKFLLILNISTIISIVLLLTSLIFWLKKWFLKHTETISLLHIIGAEDSLIMHIFERYIHKNLIKGLIYSFISACAFFLISTQIIVRTNLIESIWRINPVSAILLAVLCIVIIYVTVRIRIHNIIHKCLYKSASI